MAERDQVRGRIASLLHQPEERLADPTVLTDLVADSMILVNMVIQLQQELRVRLVGDDLRDVRTVGQLLDIFERKMAVST